MKAIRFSLVIAIFSVILSFVFINKVIALDIPTAPTLEMPILDQTNTLTTEQKDILAEQINKERLESSNQIVILIINSLEGESIEDYSINVSRQWGIGTNYNNNGVLLLVALNDRELRIEVGSGLEGALTDAISSRIRRNDITPAFKDGRYYDGISLGLNSIIKAIHGEYTAKSQEKNSDYMFDIVFEIFYYFLVFIVIWLGSILGRTKSWWLGGVIGFALGFIILVISGFKPYGVFWILVLTPVGLLFDKVVSKNYKKRTKSGHHPNWWAGGGFFGGGSSSGGGGGSFGGGGFSGGGSSGSW